MLHAVFDPLDRAAQFHRAERNDEVLRVELAAYAETSANIGLDKVDTVFRHLQKRGQDPPVEVGHLGLAPHGHVAGPGGEGRHQTPSLERVSGVPVAAEFLFAGVLRFGERAIRVPQRTLELQGQVGAVFLEQKHVAFFRRPDIDDGRKGLVFHLDGVQGVLGQVTALRHHHRHRLSHVSNLLSRQRILQEPLQPGIRAPAHGNRTGLYGLHDVLKSVNGLNAFHLQSGGRVDG